MLNARSWMYHSPLRFYILLTAHLDIRLQWKPTRCTIYLQFYVINEVDWQNSAPRWFSLQMNIKMHGQQNIEFDVTNKQNKYTDIRTSNWSCKRQTQQYNKTCRRLTDEIKMKMNSVSSLFSLQKRSCKMLGTTYSVEQQNIPEDLKPQFQIL
jgi:hypothetical protein